uniref:Uncharacterized protein n=1 Tax=Arundo donax TaxID=35708 RepID=A0A0A9BLY7_ARUDO
MVLVYYYPQFTYDSMGLISLLFKNIKFFFLLVFASNWF